MSQWKRAVLVVVLASWAGSAEAFPAFARKYGMSCSACHLAWPIFNPVGQHFRDNGYQFGLGKDDPTTISADYLGLAIRTTPAYQYTRVTNQASAEGPVDVVTGGIPTTPGVDLLSGGVIAPGISWLVVLAGFSPSDGAVAAESAFVRLNRLGGSGWANLRIGKFELDQPASAHRGITLTSGYAVYGAHPPGSLVPLDLGENQTGIELDGHDDRSATRYSLSFTSTLDASASQPSKGGWSTPLVYAHVQHAFELDNGVLPWVRVGALGAMGWWPTTFATSDGTTPIPGTGRDHKTYERAGAELSWMLGEPTTPAFFTASWMWGHEEKGLAAGQDPVTGEDLSTRAAEFQGGFLEIDWVPWVEPRYDATPWVFFGRYDFVRYRNGVGDVDGGTVGVRRYLVLGPRASAAVHVELHYDRAKRTSEIVDAAGLPRDVETSAALAGIDFDF